MSNDIRLNVAVFGTLVNSKIIINRLIEKGVSNVTCFISDTDRNYKSFSEVACEINKQAGRNIVQIYKLDLSILGPLCFNCMFDFVVNNLSRIESDNLLNVYFQSPDYYKSPMIFAGEFLYSAIAEKLIKDTAEFCYRQRINVEAYSPMLSRMKQRKGNHIYKLFSPKLYQVPCSNVSYTTTDQLVEKITQCLGTNNFSILYPRLSPDEFFSADCKKKVYSFSSFPQEFHGKTLLDINYQINCIIWVKHDGRIDGFYLEDDGRFFSNYLRKL